MPKQSAKVLIIFVHKSVFSLYFSFNQEICAISMPLWCFRVKGLYFKDKLTANNLLPPLWGLNG